MNKAREIASLICLVCLMSFPRSLLYVKVISLFVFFMIHLWMMIYRKPLIIFPRIIIYYIFIAFVGIVWGMIGVIHGSFSDYVLDNIRLWTLWGLIYAIIFTLLRNHNNTRLIHTAIVVSGVLISLLNFVGLFDSYAQLGIFSESTKTELEMSIGFHSGYIQIMSHNIGSLFFIVPYLVVIQVRRDFKNLNNVLAKISLFLCFILVALSGRRALWLSVMLVPITILIISRLTQGLHLLKPRQKNMIYVYTFGLFMIIPTVIAFGHGMDSATIDHLRAAFSEEDERSIQMGYLIDSILKHPIFGSGFGAVSGYIRSYEEPWLYELSYFQLLFNLGILGFAFVFGGVGLFFGFVIKIVQRSPESSCIAFAVLVGLSSFFIGTYSNPYLGSFDFLFFLGLLPYLSTFTGGYSEDLISGNSTFRLIPSLGCR